MSLVIILKGRSTGLTYKEMQEELNWKEGIKPTVRTLQRMLEKIRDDLGLEWDYVEGGNYHHKERKYVIRELPQYMAVLDPRERVAIETHIKELERGTLREALTKVVAGQEPLSTSLTMNLEQLIEQTSHAGKAQPRTQYDRNQMRDIETAIQASLELSFKYRAQSAKKASQRQVRPIGVVFNRFAYLIASTGNREPLSYRMDMLQEVKIMDVGFVPPEGFNFKQWVNESFGVYHGDELLNIQIRFAPEVAERASKITFHSTQEQRPQKDGSLILRMQCKGHSEICHELMHPDWIGHVKIENPEQLREVYAKQLELAKLAI
jgi:predicted DNA-binding transcriptional regulator YafY